MQLFHSFIKSINVTCDPGLSIRIRNSMRLHQLHSPIDRLGSYIMRSIAYVEIQPQYHHDKTHALSLNHDP